MVLKLKIVMKNSGFTLVELVVTMMIIGILAVAVVPRFLDTADFDSRRFRDEVMAALQYGHKTAVASRRNVCVAFAPNRVTLTIAAAVGNGQACNRNLTGPNGATPFVVNAPGNAVFNGAPANFFFDALGRSSVPAQMIQITGTAAVIVVEQESGYVHP